MADAAPEELLSQLYDGSGGRFLTYLSAMSETDRQTVCRKLDTILQGGTAEQQSLYLDAVQTMAWCSHSFDDAQREAYDYFLEHSARSSQAAYRAQAVMDALTGGGAVQMRLEPATASGAATIPLAFPTAAALSGRRAFPAAFTGPRPRTAIPPAAASPCKARTDAAPLPRGRIPLSCAARNRGKPHG